MKVLVANLGSTSFKYRLYDLGDPSEPLLARGAVERIGATEAKVKFVSSKGEAELVEPIPDHGVAMQICLNQLTTPEFGVITSAEDVAAIGFKAVHARGLTGVVQVNESVLKAMEAFNDVCPAHNPPYVKAMRTLHSRFPKLPLVAAFETGFHTTISEANRRYAVPDNWATDFGVLRWGFHGASHRYIADRMPSILGRKNIKLISMHLGGSSSLCAIREGNSVATSMGMSPQTGLPHNNRIGDFDVFALPVIMRETGMNLEQILDTLANRSGLEGLSGAGRDLRDIEEAADAGNDRARLAIDVFIASIRHYLGAYLVELGGADAIVFTAGIGENSARIRSGVCRDLESFGIQLDEDRNVKGGESERLLSTPESRVQVWTVPTNEEIIVARQTRDLLASS